MFAQEFLKKYGAERQRKFIQVYAALQKLPLTSFQFTFLLSQILTETGVFSSMSNVFTLNNNASGILYTGSKKQKENNATKGSKRLIIEGGYYAKFRNLDDWAKEYFRILNKGSMPIMATNIKNFGFRLKENNYFTDSLEKYQKNLNFFYNFLKKYNI